MTERSLTRGAAAVLAAILLTSAARAADGLLELSWRSEGGRSSFAFAGRLEAPRGTLVLITLGFDGEVVPGSLRRIELGPDQMVRVSWETRDLVLPGEYEAVATIESSRQPRTLRAALPGPARVF